MSLAVPLAACSNTRSDTEPTREGGTPSSDAALDVGHADHTAMAKEGGADASADSPLPADVTLSTTALVRLANWSPDAPGLDVCLAPHGTGLFTRPFLASVLGSGPLGDVTVTDAGFVKDSGVKRDAGTADDADAADGSSDASAANASDAPSAFVDGGDGGSVHDATAESEAGSDGKAGASAGVPFPRLSPYASLTPGEYDLRVVAAGSANCDAPLFAEVDDAPAQKAGDTLTFAVVGDTVAQGSDPSLRLSVLYDDTTVAPGKDRLRFIDAVPSVSGVSLLEGLVDNATGVPYFVAAQFGTASADADAGALDPNDYLSLGPVTNAIWSLVNANGGTTTLVEVGGVAVPAGRIATVVAVGGESGPNEAAVGILLCTDQAPVVSGETASCQLLQGSVGGVCPGCP